MKNPEKLAVVVDTNVLLVSISSRSQFHWFYQALLKGEFRIAVTLDILLEYEEKIGEHWSSSVATNVIRSVTELNNAIFVPVYYHLNLILEDKDDNKFVDCAFAANANYIVTQDKHFNILRTIPFPKILVADIDKFKKVLESTNNL